ncbi:MAG TPA: hypothetical protein VER96_01770 [Polyangiaceae bacterium]|nr:hypothetical protein [Polyangiaceae bacterium]
MAALVLGVLCSTRAVSRAADPPKERYYFELKAITPKAELKAESVKAATPRVLAELKKAFEHHPQIVVQLEGAPDPKVDPDAYRRYLEKSHIAGAFAVNVELTEATETTAPVADKPGAQEHETRLALRMLGTRIPDDTLGFTGHGKANAKGDGAKASERERQETWDQLSELAVSKAIATALDELTLAAKIKPKPKYKAKPKPAGGAAPAPH